MCNYLFSSLENANLLNSSSAKNWEDIGAIEPTVVPPTHLFSIRDSADQQDNQTDLILENHVTNLNLAPGPGQWSSSSNASEAESNTSVSFSESEEVLSGLKARNRNAIKNSTAAPAPSVANAAAAAVGDFVDYVVDNNLIDTSNLLANVNSSTKPKRSLQFRSAIQTHGANDQLAQPAANPTAAPDVPRASIKTMCDSFLDLIRSRRHQLLGLARLDLKTRFFDFDESVTSVQYCDNFKANNT